MTRVDGFESTETLKRLLLQPFTARKNLMADQNPWETFKAKLQAYVDEFGTARIPQANVDATGYQLGRAVVNTRQGNLLHGPDAAERRAWLEALPGWTWSLEEDRWKTFQESLRAYVDELGTARVPRNYVDASGYRLGQTVVNTRQGSLVNGPDAAARRAWVEALPGWSWTA